MTPVKRAASALAIAALLGGCGGASAHKPAKPKASAPASAARPPAHTIRMVMGTAPQSLDPGVDYSSEGAEVNWLVYTGLTTYRHASGSAGTQLIPGLAATLPKISDGGRTYTVTLRGGLAYSNGTYVHASDFTHTVERAIRLPWGGAGAFLIPRIVGAQAYADGRARSISGITTDNATRRIVIHLTAPYGAFDNVLAFPALGLVPASTPMQEEPANPPPGVGPYLVTNIVAKQVFELVRNPEWPKLEIPGIPAGQEDIEVTIDTDTDANAQAVLHNTADLFDWADQVPASRLTQIRRAASDRFRLVDLGGSTEYIFMNVTEPPFNNRLVRQAVVTGIDMDHIAALSAGALQPSCFLLPSAVPGHQSTRGCPYGKPGSGDLAKAKRLVTRSGEAGKAVTVWSELGSPRQQWMQYYTRLLNEIGLKATLHVVPENYFDTVGETQVVDPQTGFTDWNQDFPNPVDFYGVLLAGDAILPVGNSNLGQVDDPHLNSTIQQLSAVSPAKLASAVPRWQALERYVAKRAYIAVLGYLSFPFFTSDRVEQSDEMTSPIYGWDLGALRLK